MTKNSELQKELKEKVKEGVKPSDFKKLKKSKSTGDIPKTPPLPQSTPLTRSSSAQSPVSDTKYPYTALISQQQTIEKLEQESKTKSTTISLLRKRNDELEVQSQKNPPSSLLQDQLTTKQKDLENLRKHLETANSELKETKQELDNSLLARYEALKTFGKVSQKLKQVKQELDENVDQASEELVNQDETIAKLRTSQQKAQTKIQELERDLNLSQRLIKLKEFSFPNPETGSNYLRYALYSLLAVGFTLWLTNRNQIKYDIRN